MCVEQNICQALLILRMEGDSFSKRDIECGYSAMHHGPRRSRYGDHFTVKDTTSD
jgi:hypothetical protein